MKNTIIVLALAGVLFGGCATSRNIGEREVSEKLQKARSHKYVSTGLFRGIAVETIAQNLSGFSIEEDVQSYLQEQRALWDSGGPEIAPHETNIRSGKEVKGSSHKQLIKRHEDLSRPNKVDLPPPGERSEIRIYEFEVIADGRCHRLTERTLERQILDEFELCSSKDLHTVSVVTEQGIRYLFEGGGYPSPRGIILPPAKNMSQDNIDALLCHAGMTNFQESVCELKRVYRRSTDEGSLLVAVFKSKKFPTVSEISFLEDKGCRLHSYKLFKDGKPSKISTFSDYRSVSGTIMYPHRIRYVNVDSSTLLPEIANALEAKELDLWDEKVLGSATIESAHTWDIAIQHMEPGASAIPEDAFTLAFPAGTQVTEISSGKTIRYVEGAE